MKTFLAQNQFLNSTATSEPPAVGSAVAAAEPFEATCKESLQVQSERFCSDFQVNETSIFEPSMTNGGDPGTPASAPSKNPDVGVLADRIDWHEFFEAVMDERIVLFELYDEVPLFIRSGDHLRRWNA